MEESMPQQDMDSILEKAFRREREVAQREAPLPDPVFLYQLAVARRRREARKKAMRPIFLVEIAACLFAAIALTAIAALTVPGLDWSRLMAFHLHPLMPATGAAVFGVAVLLILSSFIFAEE